ncbi:MAG: hypothetical protein PHP64_01440 [Actinomycetota bacterium]|nr:hypothetical protein [Actinomycetota bacterium]
MARKYGMARCRGCGFPKIVNFFMKWNDNGTVTQLMRRDYRVVILHQGFIDNLFSHIDTKLGLPIEHIAFEAQRNASKAVFQAFYDRIPGTAYMVKPNFAKRLAVEGFNRVAVITGQCHSKTIEYVPGKYGIAKIRNPFHLDLMAANVVGAFETLESIPFEYSWNEEPDESYIIRVDAAGEKLEMASRMELEFKKPLPGNNPPSRCERCGAPTGLSHLKWLEDDGIILDTRTGSRVIFLDGYMVKTVFRELTRELGDVMNDIVIEAQKDWTAEHVRKLGLAGNNSLSPEEFEKKYMEYLGLFPLYGWGNPIHTSIGPAETSMTIENCYENYTIAGILRGLYESLLRSKCTVEFTEDRADVVSYSLKPLE